MPRVAKFGPRGDDGLGESPMGIIHTRPSTGPTFPTFSYFFVKILIFLFFPLKIFIFLLFPTFCQIKKEKKNPFAIGLIFVWSWVVFTGCCWEYCNYHHHLFVKENLFPRILAFSPILEL